MLGLRWIINICKSFRSTVGYSANLEVQEFQGGQVDQQTQEHHQYHCSLAVHPLLLARQAQEGLGCLPCLETLAYPYFLGCLFLLWRHGPHSLPALREDLPRVNKRGISFSIKSWPREKQSHKKKYKHPSPVTKGDIKKDQEKLTVKVLCCTMLWINCVGDTYVSVHPCSSKKYLVNHK